MKVMAVLQTVQGPRHNALMPNWKLKKEQKTASIKDMDVKFDVLVGCRQGGQESPFLFNLYFDYVLKIAANKIDEAFPEGWGINFEYEIPHTCTNQAQRSVGKMRGVEIIRWILYADDVVLFCVRAKDAERMLTIIDDTCKRFGLNISFGKTKTQVFNDAVLHETTFQLGAYIKKNHQ